MHSRGGDRAFICAMKGRVHCVMHPNALQDFCMVQFSLQELCECMICKERNQGIQNPLQWAVEGWQRLLVWKCYMSYIYIYRYLNVDFQKTLTGRGFWRTVLTRLKASKAEESVEPLESQEESTKTVTSRAQCQKVALSTVTS